MVGKKERKEGRVKGRGEGREEVKELDKGGKELEAGHYDCLRDSVTHEGEGAEDSQVQG